MKVYLYLVVSDSYPERICGGEEIILIRDEAEMKTELGLDDLGFVSTLGIRSNVSDEVLNEFLDWWGETVGISVKTKKLTSEPSSIQDYRLLEIESLGENEWTLKSTFLAYPKDSSASYERAIEFIKESELICH
jgi:hypothetical protein